MLRLHPLRARQCWPAISYRATCRHRAIAHAAAQAAEQQLHVTVVGGGAAGLTAAFFAAEYGARVTVLERTREAGKKVLMSGGSRW
jgi:NADPH-dependent 2,4-dienoyl-CoA reductase/sulfur reductase-like enzyme